MGKGHAPGRTRHLHLWIVAVAVACNDVQVTDTTEERVIPADGSDIPARFSLSTRLRTDTGASSGVRWEIHATMHPGLEDGFVREAGDTLWLDGRPYLPDLVDRGYRRYRAELETALDRVHERIVTVEPPAVDGVAPPPIVQLVGIGRLGGDTIQWTPGSDFVFHLTVPAAPPTPDPVASSWGLSVTQDSARLTLQSSGLPPDSITVAGRYFSTGGSQIVAFFSFRFSGYEPTDDPQGYLLSYFVSGDFFWVVEVVEAGT